MDMDNYNPEEVEKMTAIIMAVHGRPRTDFEQDWFFFSGCGACFACNGATFFAFQNKDCSNCNSCIYTLYAFCFLMLLAPWIACAYHGRPPSCGIGPKGKFAYQIITISAAIAMRLCFGNAWYWLALLVGLTMLIHGVKQLCSPTLEMTRLEVLFGVLMQCLLFLAMANIYVFIVVVIWSVAIIFCRCWSYMMLISYFGVKFKLT